MPLIKDYVVFDKYVNNVYQIEDLKFPPFRFYNGSNNMSQVCVVTSDGNVIYTVGSKEADEKINSKFEDIAKLTTNHTVLVSYNEERPRIIFDFDLKKFYAPFSEYPSKNEGVSFLIFDRFDKPYFIRDRLVDSIIALNESSHFIEGETIRLDNIDLFLDIQFFTRGSSFTFTERNSLRDKILPLESNVLLEGQVKEVKSFFMKIIKKEKQQNQDLEKRSENYSNLFNIGDGSELLISPFDFTSILDGLIPDVTKETQINLDMDLSSYGIISASVVPGKLLTFDIKGHHLQIAEMKENIRDMLGHSNFTIVFHSLD